MVRVWSPVGEPLTQTGAWLFDQQRRQDAQRAAQPEMAETDRTVLLVLRAHKRGDEEATQKEEYRHSEGTRYPRPAQGVVAEHDQKAAARMPSSEGMWRELVAEAGEARSGARVTAGLPSGCAADNEEAAVSCNSEADATAGILSCDRPEHRRSPATGVAGPAGIGRRQPGAGTAATVSCGRAVYTAVDRGLIGPSA
jgi:hypothetical protein